jgi:hypothetical protein
VQSRKFSSVFSNESERVGFHQHFDGPFATVNLLLELISQIADRFRLSA